MTNEPTDPHHLIELRRRKQLSRQALAGEAKVSERQLARIEAGHVRMRNSTLHRLAKALDVAPEAISGAQSLPEADDEVPPLQIGPENLRALRKSKGLSRSALAHKARVSERQIARLESPNPTPRKVRTTTIKRIATALDADVKALSGSVPAARKPEPREQVRVGLQVSAQLLLAFDLIRLRYGPTPRQVIELAPMLFALLAEGSLAWRRGHVAKIEEAIRHLHELSDDSQLYFAWTEYIADGVEYEKGSIMNADLLRDDLREDDWYIADYAEPFATYLRKMAEDLGTEGIVDFDQSDSAVGPPLSNIWGAESYVVCRDTLDELTGGSKYARWALVHGDVQLSKIPKDLLKPEAKDDRIAWLESKLSDKVRNREEATEAYAKTLRTIEGNEERSDTEAAHPAGESR